MTISEKGWIGDLIPVEISEKAVLGTVLQFTDEPWSLEEVEKHAVFSGLKVLIDNQACSKESFVSQAAVPHRELGCTIEVIPRQAMDPWHRHWQPNYYSDDMLVNFHGQVIQFY